MANSAELALQVGETLGVAMAASTKAAREAMLASAPVVIPDIPPANPEVSPWFVLVCQSVCEDDEHGLWRSYHL